jgi:hypothetical protein
MGDLCQGGTALMTWPSQFRTMHRNVQPHPPPHQPAPQVAAASATAATAGQAAETLEALDACRRELAVVAATRQAAEAEVATLRSELAAAADEAEGVAARRQVSERVMVRMGGVGGPLASLGRRTGVLVRLRTGAGLAAMQVAPPHTCPSFGGHDSVHGCQAVRRSSPESPETWRDSASQPASDAPRPLFRCPTLSEGNACDTL